MTEFNTNFFDRSLETLNRNERAPFLRQILLETMASPNYKPVTKPDLQKLARIRKKTFGRLLKDLISEGTINRISSGTKGDPHRYLLATGNQKK